MTNQDHRDGSESTVRQQYLEWFDSEISLLTEYHNHKETMAWSATIAYVGVLVLAYSAAGWLVDSITRFLLSFVLAGLGFVTWFFSKMQFDMRWVAADWIAALRRVKGTLLDGTSSWASFVRTVPTANPVQTIEKTQWPGFVETEMERCRTERQSLKEVVRILFQRMPGEVNARRQSELASYFVIAALTIVAIATVWIGRPDGDIDARLTEITESLRQLETRLP